MAKALEDFEIATAARNRASAAKGFTDQDRVELTEIADMIAQRDFGHALRKCETVGGAESMIAAAIIERDTARTAKRAAPVYSPEIVARKLSAKSAFGKAETVAGKRIAHADAGIRRAAHLKLLGGNLAEFNADMEAWHATTDLRVAGRNPDKGDKKLKRAMRSAEPVEDATDFNLAMGRKTVADNVAAKFKPKAKGDSKSENPYQWPSDKPGRLEAIAKIMGRMPTKFVAELATAAGCSVSGAKLR